MERYFKKQCHKHTSNDPRSSSSTSKESELDAIISNLLGDPGLRPRMLDYDCNLWDEIRRAYLLKGPCQPKMNVEDFPQTRISGYNRRFNRDWFDEFIWLEYSKDKDAGFCLPCYLFKTKIEQGCNDAFTEIGFRNWKKKEKLKEHVGGVGSVHNQATQACADLMNQKQHIETIVIKQSNQVRINYCICLNAAIDCTRFLLLQGLSFCAHDETESSSNKGNYVELMAFLTNHDVKVKAVVFDNAPGNLKLIAPKIQKDLVNACAVETIDAITKDVNGEFFSILVDESRDCSTNEQIAVVFRYVDKRGHVIESFVGVQHVADTFSSTLKDAIDRLLSTTNMSMSMLRGQGYDGASNMKGEFNGLKVKILKENPYAYYIHCFAHQLQLALVAVAKGHADIATFFTKVNSLVNIIGASCKRRDLLRDQLQKDLMEALEDDCLETGRGLNEETSLKRAGDKRWNSHYGTLVSIISMFKSVVKVLKLIIEDGSTSHLGEANRSFEDIQTFQFVFHLFLMRSILGATNDLSQALQKKDQDIVNVMALVQASKQQLQYMRDNEFGLLLDQVSCFCDEHDIDVPNMDDPYYAPGKSKHVASTLTICHHYRVDLFAHVIDYQLSKLNNRFNEVSIELLICMACLSPDNSFSTFNKHKLLRFAQFYPQEFSSRELFTLGDQLGVYMHDMHLSNDFCSLKGISSLAKEMVKTGKHRVYKHVYLLLTLALVLPVATASVERAFSAMNIVKTPLRNKMGDQWLSDSLVVYIERDIFVCIDNEAIMRRFQDMKGHRGQL